jgi:glycyl-tRNA synthetase (class II)
MRICHYQWRGFAHYLRKCVDISKAYEISGLREIYGQHLKRVYNVWKAQGEAGVRDMYQREVYVSESGMGELVRDDTVAAALGLTNSP